MIFAQQSNDVYDNIIEFQIRGYEGDFLNGYLCALMNEGSDQLGFCASMDEASVRTAINSFALGAKYANPNATVQVLWADSWYDLDIESQNAKTLIDNGIKYMGMEASSPAVPQTCEEHGAYCVGYNVDMQESAPKAVLTSFVWNWAPIFEDIMQKTADGTIDISANYYEGGECAALAPFNQDLVPQDIQDKVNELRDKINNGEVKVYAGELKDDQGNVLVKDGEEMADEDILALKELKNVYDVTYENHKLTILCSNGKHNLIHILDYLQTKNLSFGRVYSELPTLNDVFLEMTGKELRD